MVGNLASDGENVARASPAPRVDGLYDEPRLGRPRTVEEEQIKWRPRTTGRTGQCAPRPSRSELSKSTVQRVWSAFGVQPHRQGHLKLSADPFFVEKLVDIRGLYLNPPEHAMVLCVDEKSSTQALERTQPLLPLGLGYVEGVTTAESIEGFTA